MQNTHSRRPGAAEDGRTLPAASSIATAVFFALYGMPHPVMADQSEPSAGALQEVVVTATRREQTLEAVPYSISVVSGCAFEFSGLPGSRGSE